ncbi:hypothetical protein FA95DRAFT_1492219 [Auriscalpium vulgare]|uniref:Uncharacterized protein n=1 Tax=Auriscalpium vulgare TaxID=40419 RepID=A0ACB8RV20_9AGAM|nr:hypothetical protein FA95DRAFT_1492219 [Auriscalpium vulgare]
MIKLCTVIHRRRNRVTFQIFSISFSRDASPRPIPAHECSVTPPMFKAAMPVDAVVTSLDGSCGSLRTLMISRRRTDLPVPAYPVKNTFSPRITLRRTSCCSRESSILGTTATSSSFGSGNDASPYASNSICLIASSSSTLMNTTELAGETGTSYWSSSRPVSAGCDADGPTLAAETKSQ